MGFRFWQYRGEASDSPWLAEHVFEWRGLLGNRPPRRETWGILPLSDDPRWSRTIKLQYEYNEVPEDQVPSEVRAAAAMLLGSAPEWLHPAHNVDCADATVNRPSMP